VGFSRKLNKLFTFMLNYKKLILRY